MITLLAIASAVGVIRTEVDFKGQESVTEQAEQAKTAPTKVCVCPTGFSKNSPPASAQNSLYCYATSATGACEAPDGQNHGFVSHHKWRKAWSRLATECEAQYNRRACSEPPVTQDLPTTFDQHCISKDCRGKCLARSTWGLTHSYCKHDKSDQQYCEEDYEGEVCPA
eukprot:CAMPEP_0197661706 /NCGR_PEP_ID=MMETSP1338-20131121/51616_1 /TAXON_ID=43686 ORGANISM="Pelagodinium beii, Strain RCC1491" /NCGR_SAMPLE_ID=MMETSP1338 /ASSEMBLY_ACC=CAM_ASM_000754 /LENGTH=167 /DNA_ID=CAMNT_0043239309 /DNA_START=93 /DNA_END=596 /DNA_ORIENTATION=+